jgi:hypothetical protein
MSQEISSTTQTERPRIRLPHLTTEEANNYAEAETILGQVYTGILGIYLDDKQKDFLNSAKCSMVAEESFEQALALASPQAVVYPHGEVNISLDSLDISQNLRRLSQKAELEPKEEVGSPDVMTQCFAERSATADFILSLVHQKTLILQDPDLHIYLRLAHSHRAQIDVGRRCGVEPFLLPSKYAAINTMFEGLLEKFGVDRIYSLCFGKITNTQEKQKLLQEIDDFVNPEPDNLAY